MAETKEPVAWGRAVLALSVGQMLGYACMYYIFAALVLSWQADLGWSKADLALGPTLAILISAACAPILGRQVDRGRGPELMVFGAALGVVALLFLSQITTQRDWLIGWAILGLAQATSLYEVCFSFLIRRLGPQARSAITRVTLVAGFASSLAFPAGAALAASYGWRTTVVIAAVTMGVVVLPLNIWGTRAIRRLGPRPGEPTRDADRGALRAALRRPTFWILSFSFALMSLNHWMIVNFLVPIFIEQGASHDRAVLAAAFVGPALVVGRVILMRFEGRIGTVMTTRLMMLGMVVSSLILAAAGLMPVLILLYALTQGAAMGIMTILRPVTTAELLGQAGYGAIAGVIVIPTLVAGAVAPLLGALILSGPGLNALLALSFGVTLVAFCGMALIGREGR